VFVYEMCKCVHVYKHPCFHVCMCTSVHVYICQDVLVQTTPNEVDNAQLVSRVTNFTQSPPGPVGEQSISSIYELLEITGTLDGNLDFMISTTAGILGQNGRTTHFNLRATHFIESIISPSKIYCYIKTTTSLSPKITTFAAVCHVLAL